MTPAEYRSLRLSANLSQDDLGEIMDVHRTTISHRETGHPEYPINAEAALALKYAVMERLYGDFATNTLETDQDRS